MLKNRKEMIFMEAILLEMRAEAAPPDDAYAISEQIHALKERVAKEEPTLMGQIDELYCAFDLRYMLG
jgi:hypothetical protein